VRGRGVAECDSSGQEQKAAGNREEEGKQQKKQTETAETSEGKENTAENSEKRNNLCVPTVTKRKTQHKGKKEEYI